MILVILVCTIIYLVTLLPGCINQDEKDILVGSWKMGQLDNANQNESNIYDFYKNGTFLSQYTDLDRNETHTGWGDYSIKKGNVICMNTHPHGSVTDNDSICYEYEFSDNNKELKLFPEGISSISEITLFRTN